MKPANIALTLAASILFLFCNCQNDTEDMPDFHSFGKVALSLNVSAYQQMDFQDAHPAKAESFSSTHKNLMLAIYKGETLDTLVTQHDGDANFGHLSFDLSPAPYRFVLLAHNSDVQPNMKNPKYIDFGQKNMSDVLLWSNNISINKDTVLNVTMRRVVAKVEINSTDSLPIDANQVYLWFRGGSYALNAETGMANKFIEDYRLIDLTKAEIGKPLSLSFYTFPTAKDDFIKELSIRISKNGNIVESKTINNIPIKANHVTHLTGSIH